MISQHICDINYCVLLVSAPNVSKFSGDISQLTNLLWKSFTVATFLSQEQKKTKYEAISLSWGHAAATQLL